MWKQLYDLVFKIILTVGVLLSVIAIAQLVNLCLLVYRMHPATGLVLGIVFGILVLWGLAAFLIRLRRFPRVLKPPPLPPFEKASHKEMVRFCRYLQRYLQRLALNPELDQEQRQQALARVEQIGEILAHHPIRDDLIHTIESTESDHILPLLGALRDCARKEVRTCVRDVMLGVTLIPYQGIDLLIVIYRNGAMVLRIAEIFASRPALTEQLLILRDVLKVIATVNFVNVSRNLIEGLFSHVPVLGRYVDDIGQGLGAGIFTSAAGQAAIERCAAYEGWNQADAVATVAGKMRTFLTDVRDIFTKDVLPSMKGRIRNELSREDVEESPAFWSGLTGAIGTAMDATATTMESLVLKPAVAGTMKVADAGFRVKKGIGHAGGGVGRAVKRVFGRDK